MGPRKKFIWDDKLRWVSRSGSCTEGAGYDGLGQWSRTLGDFAQQDAAVQPGEGEAGLLRAGGQKLAVTGGVPQGLHGDRSQAPVAKRMDADQVLVFSSHSKHALCCVYKYSAWIFFFCPTGFCLKRALRLTVTSPATRESSTHGVYLA